MAPMKSALTACTDGSEVSPHQTDATKCAWISNSGNGTTWEKTSSLTMGLVGIHGMGLHHNECWRNYCVHWKEILNIPLTLNGRPMNTIEGRWIWKRWRYSGTTLLFTMETPHSVIYKGRKRNGTEGVFRANLIKKGDARSIRLGELMLDTHV